MLIELKGSAGDGLLSHSEFLAVGVDPTLAQELLAAKVTFSGTSITPEYRRCSPGSSSL